MPISSKSLQDGFWDKYQINDSDIEFLFNHLIEVEEPLPTMELLKVLIQHIIGEEKKNLEKQQKIKEKVYLPQNQFEVNDVLVFPHLKWKQGIVKQVRNGFNPDISPFEVIEVEFQDNEHHLFVANLKDHALNLSANTLIDDPSLDPVYVMKHYKDILIDKLNLGLEHNPDLIRTGDLWFPQTLLVDVNIGYLNLAEALLDMNDGGPLSTKSILEQIDLPTDVNSKLTEFSLNYALQEDERFDEVGPAGEISWFLHKLEPEAVINMPLWIKYSGPDYQSETVSQMLAMFDDHVIDEYESCSQPFDQSDEIPIALIYPHWRSGTLPLSKSLSKIFPKAYESPRILFKFLDTNTNESFNGWVILNQKFVYGLEEFYNSNNLIPGNIVYISKNDQPGVINIHVDKRKPGREWIRTATVNANGGVSFTMLKQMVSAAYDERMALFVQDKKSIDLLWENPGRSKLTMEKAVFSTMLELSKLNPQGQVHSQELYAALNLIKRCPPGVALKTLIESQKAFFLGDLYFRIDDNTLALERNAP